MTLQQELVDFSLSRTDRVIGEINWITFHVELNVFCHYLPAVCQPLGHYQGMSHIKMTELDWLCWGNSWTSCHRLRQLLTSSPHTCKCQKLVYRLAGLADTNIPLLEGSGFPHRNSHVECVWGEKGGFQKTRREPMKESSLRKKFNNLPNSLGQKVAELRLPQVTPTPSSTFKCQKDV